MTDFNPVSGIAWDDDLDYFDRVLKELSGDRRHISFRLTDNKAEFEQWSQTDDYDFVLLDIFEMDQPTRGMASPEGLKLCMAIRQQHADLPIVLATDLYDTIDQQVQSQWNLGAATSLWSKSTRENWFAQELAKLLSQRGLVVEIGTLLVVGELKDAEKEELTTRLKPAAIIPTFEESLEAIGCWDDVVERIRSFAGFLAVARHGGKDRVAMDVGRILAMPRGIQRLVVSCPIGEFPWLDVRIVGGKRSLTCHFDQEVIVTDDLIQKIKAVMQS